MKTPPQPCEAVCAAVMHLLAGTEPSVAVKRNGSVLSTSWEACVKMMKSASFGKSLKDLSSTIDQGKCAAENVEAARKLLESIGRDSNLDKVQYMNPVSRGAASLCEWALAMEAYFAATAQISDRFEGRCMQELFPPEALNGAD